MKALLYFIFLVLTNLVLPFHVCGQIQDTSVITLKKYNILVADKDRPVLVYFSADWCGVCNKMKPVIDEISKRDSLKLKIIKIDIDKDVELKEEFEIDALPVLMIYVNGCREWLNIGIINPKELNYIIDHFLKAK